MLPTKTVPIGLLLASMTLATTNGAILISEIADKGSSGVCDGNDWVELYNTGPEAVTLSGWVLHDDGGADHPNAFRFPSDDEATTIMDEEYMLLCTGGMYAMSPQFGIGGDDTITLRNSNGEIVSSVGPLLGGRFNGFDITYAWNNNNNNEAIYNYTKTTTPGEANIITPLGLETVQEIKDRLIRQNEEGTRFFDMDTRGLPVPDGMPAVVDLHLEMEESEYDYLIQNQTYEKYVPFQNIKVLDGETELLYLSSPGRIRSKGQYTLYMSTCLGSPTLPFQIDLVHTNASQTLFGVEEFYLRNHVGDPSFIREWSMNRMFARFGLPHLRARHVRFYINGNKHGLYTLLEAVPQDYVFARNFAATNPKLDPIRRSLFKVKTFSLACGDNLPWLPRFDPTRMNETSTPPYAFERGDHRTKVPVLASDGTTIDWLAYGPCAIGFGERLIAQDGSDVMLAYMRSGPADCGSFLVKHGLVDRDLGTKDAEPAMEQFINDNLGFKTCTPGCTNSDLASQVDVDNFLKTFAVYAATISMDSPMGNGNNYYLANTGDDSGWKIVPYDNDAGKPLCLDGICQTEPIFWSILRPTCQDLETNQLVGPLLTNKTLHGKYIDYVGSFVNTVMGNSSFMGLLETHLKAIEPHVRHDFWSSPPGSFDLELSTNASDWNNNEMGASHPWVPYIKARAQELRLQLEALDAGTFARGPHLPVPVEPQEVCVDWRSTEPAIHEEGCFQNCRYEGCHQDGWLVPSFCDTMRGVCSHGDFDENCRDVPDGGRYEGMQRPGVCWNIMDSPGVMNDCPPPPTIGCMMDEDCLYEGCDMEGFTVRCEPSNSICYHGQVDEACADIGDMGRYEGMAGRDGRPTFCWENNLSVSECPPMPMAAPEGCQSDEDCNYEGCFMEGWTLEKMCSPDDSLCYHADRDDQCEGIPDLGMYEGMESRGGRIAICFNVAGTPTKLSQCPPPPVPIVESGSSAASTDGNGPGSTKAPAPEEEPSTEESSSPSPSDKEAALESSADSSASTPLFLLFLLAVNALLMFYM